MIGTPCWADVAAVAESQWRRYLHHLPGRAPTFYRRRAAESAILACCWLPAAGCLPLLLLPPLLLPLLLLLLLLLPPLPSACWPWTAGRCLHPSCPSPTPNTTGLQRPERLPSTFWRACWRLTPPAAALQKRRWPTSTSQTYPLARAVSACCCAVCMLPSCSRELGCVHAWRAAVVRFKQQPSGTWLSGPLRASHLTLPPLSEPSALSSSPTGSFDDLLQSTPLARSRRSGGFLNGDGSFDDMLAAGLETPLSDLQPYTVRPLAMEPSLAAMDEEPAAAAGEAAAADSTAGAAGTAGGQAAAAAASAGGPGSALAAPFAARLRVASGSESGGSGVSGGGAEGGEEPRTSPFIAPADAVMAEAATSAQQPGPGQQPPGQPGLAALQRQAQQAQRVQGSAQRRASRHYWEEVDPSKALGMLEDELQQITGEWSQRGCGPGAQGVRGLACWSFGLCQDAAAGSGMEPQACSLLLAQASGRAGGVAACKTATLQRSTLLHPPPPPPPPPPPTPPHPTPPHPTHPLPNPPAVNYSTCSPESEGCQMMRRMLEAECEAISSAGQQSAAAGAAGTAGGGEAGASAGKKRARVPHPGGSESGILSGLLKHRQGLQVG